jgi:putative MATE family efflux protein
MLSQNVLNLVDTAMVGALGSTALAAVGLGGALAFAAVALLFGLGAGVQAMIARRVGEDRMAEAAVPLNGGLLLAAGVATPWMVLLLGLTPFGFPYLIDDSSVVVAGIPYLQARLLGMPATAMNVAFRGYWNATGRPSRYMRPLMLTHGLNIALNWVLIEGHLGAPALGATGAGIASTTAQCVGTIAYAAMAWKDARGQGYLRRWPTSPTLQAIVRLSLPTGVQRLFYAGGMTAFHAIVGLLGTAELAVSTVIANLLLVGMLPGIGFGLAAMSLVGHALGRRDVPDARRWGWEVAVVAFVIIAIITFPAALAPSVPLSLFLHDEAALALAQPTLRLVALTLPFDAMGAVLINSLVGAGDAKRVMAIAIGFQWLVFLPIAFMLARWSSPSLFDVWAVNVASRCAQLVVVTMLWRRDGWTAIKV